MKKSFLLAITFALAFILIAGVYAATCNNCPVRENKNNQVICETAKQIRTGNTIDGQMSKFSCCKYCSTSTCPNCPCKGDWCKAGDIVRRHVRLDATSAYCSNNDCNLDIEADINVYNYNQLDNTQIKIRVNHLYPRNGVFTAWLVGSSGSVNLGSFTTNYMGRGFVYFQQNLPDFLAYDSLQIKDSNGVIVASAGITFLCTNPLTIE